MFVVFEDLDDATETKVHSNTCRHYVDRKLDATTTRWHGPFKNPEEAAQHARAIAERKSYGVSLRPMCCGGVDAHVT